MTKGGNQVSINIIDLEDMTNIVRSNKGGRLIVAWPSMLLRDNKHRSSSNH